MWGTSKVMLFAVVSTFSSRSGAAFLTRSTVNNISLSPQASITQAKLSMSFLEELAGNVQRAFSTSPSDKTGFYTIGVTGSSGLLGSALVDELSKQGNIDGKPVRIVKLQRSSSVGALEFGDKTQVTASWNPTEKDPNKVMDPGLLSSMDAVVHLAGENVATGLGPLGFLGIRPWSDEKKAEILSSRVGPTKALANAIAACDTPTTLLSASGIGVYGYDFTGESSPIADETMNTATTSGFLAQVSREWEAATEPAATKNRVVNMRMGVVLSKQGGALAKLYPIFFLGGGGNVGSGNQYFTFISARDAARAMVHALQTPSLKGPVNFCAGACTNAEFTNAFGKVLGRPTFLPLPGFAVELLFGEMGQEMLLGGVRAAPGKLVKSGFQFLHPSIEDALQSAVDETI